MVKVRVALYTRVSTREQAQDGYSISAQLNSLKAFCESQNWDIAGIYTDEGISAKDTNREQLKRMINDVKNNKIDVVLVYRLDRLTRSVLDLYELLDLFDKHGCGFKSATEVYDTTTGMGRLFITIVAALAQWERENLGERVSMGMLEKARQGEYPGGIAPFGYDLKDSKLTINDKEAKVVKLIYDKYLSGYSMVRITKHLNKSNIRTRKGATWHRSTIDNILKSEFVRGNILWDGNVFKNTHEPIIDKDVSMQVEQAIKDRSTKIRTSALSSNFLFSGIIQCPSCGSNLHGNVIKDGGKSYYMYRCSMRVMGKCDGKNTTVSESQLEEQLIEKLNNIDLSDLVNNVDLNIDQETSTKDLERELKKIESRKRKWQFAWVEELITDEDLKNRMKEENKQEIKIKNKLDEMENNQTINYDKDDIKRLLINVRKNWNALTRDEKKKLLQSIIKKITYEKDGRKAMLTGIEFIM